jgi:energy-coupling factor transport system permease protein
MTSVPAAGLEPTQTPRSTPTGTRRHGAASVNPVAKLAASLLLALALALSVDAVSAGVALLLELVLMPWSGLGWRHFWRRTAAVWITAPLAGLTVALYGRASGQVYLDVMLVHVTQGSLELAGITALRVLAIALPAVALFATVDPIELADGLTQLVHLPPRFVLGALAAIRMLALLRDDWRSLELARRARGLGDRARLRRFVGAAFALFVLSIRRASALATAMEARGFGGDTPHSWARVSRFGRREVLLIVTALGVALIAVGTAVATGQWVLIGR